MLNWLFPKRETVDRETVRMLGELTFYTEQVQALATSMSDFAQVSKERLDKIEADMDILKDFHSGLSCPNDAHTTSYGHHDSRKASKKSKRTRG